MLKQKSLRGFTLIEQEGSKSPSQNKSFTLIELLVVIAIIGLITSITLVAIDLPNQRQKAKIAKTLEFSSSIQSALGVEARGIWNFDDQANPTKDTSGNGNDGTLNNFASPNGYTTETPQKVVSNSLGQGKYSLSFDGNNDYVNLLSRLTGEKGTIEAWIKRTTSGVVISKGNTASIHRYLEFLVSPATYKIGADLDTGAVATIWGSTALAANQWYHVVWASDGAKYLFYVNGVLEALTVAAGSNMGQWFDDVQYQTNDIGMIGVVQKGGARSLHFNGFIDEVRIYGEALTLGQIQKDYAEGLGKHQNLAIQ